MMLYNKGLDYLWAMFDSLLQKLNIQFIDLLVSFTLLCLCFVLPASISACNRAGTEVADPQTVCRSQYTLVFCLLKHNLMFLLSLMT